MILSSSCCILLIQIIASASAVSSEYSLPGDNCSKQDSCDSKPSTRTCSCEENCHVYGTCCFDAKNSYLPPPSDPFHCYNRRTVTPVFVKRSCAESFRGHVGEVDACLDDDEDEMDVKNNLLVTSHKTKITYWNSHCATCSNEAAKDLEFWNIMVFCPKHKSVTSDLMRRNLTFQQEESRWGLQIGDEFLQCAVKYAPPPYIDEVRHCTPNIISSCPGKYSDKEVSKKCLLYYAERKLKNSEVHFKNIYCAICNRVSINQLECPGMPGSEDDPEETDFGQVVEEVFVKGSWLEKEPGKIFECSPGYAYDAFQTRCRRDESLDVVEDSVSQACKRGPPVTLLVLFALLFIL